MNFAVAKRHLWAFVDRLTLTRISAAVVALTLGSAGLYWLLSLYSSASYLAERGERTYSAWNALYFSIMTETTAGAADLVPLGWARAVASAQVLIGLILAGLAVAKLTSLHGKHVRAAVHKAAGVWIEPYEMPDGQFLVSFSVIYESDGELRYDGENLDEQGRLVGFFEGHLFESSPNILRFRYSNQDRCGDFFGEGITTHRFMSDARSGTCNRHQGNCRDWEKGIDILIQGYRATKEECAIINGTDPLARNKLVKAYVDRLRQPQPAPSRRKSRRTSVPPPAVRPGSASV